MKTTLLTLALVAAAGAAGAQTAAAPMTGGAGAAISTPSATAGAALNNSTIVNGNTGMQGAQMGTGTQAQMNNATQGVQMNSGMSATGSAGTSSNVATAPAQHMTGAAGTAQKRIEQDGYKSIQNLEQGADGLWHGTAMRGGTQVQVTVDRTGHVAAQ